MFRRKNRRCTRKLNWLVRFMINVIEEDCKIEKGQLIMAMEDFDKWWNQEGSGMPPKDTEDHEEHTRRMCELAWANGEYVASKDKPND